jgi:hypothetical protein
MSMKEINKQMNKPELLLDMDGVQCDLFGHWAKMHNATSYKDVSEEAWNVFANTSYENVYKVFRTLDPLPGGTKLVKWLKANNIKFRVCTAPLRGPYSEASKLAKHDWIAEHNPGYEDSIIYSSHKYKHAFDEDGNPRLLVDDFGAYIDKFKEAGGMTIKYRDDEIDSVIEQLKLIYQIS